MSSLPDLDRFAALVHARRTSMLVDQERPVAPELIDRLCDLAVWAPNHKRTWPWRFAAFHGDARLRLGEAGRVARVEASTRVEGAGAASDEDVHVAIVGDVDATTRLQACAPQDRIALMDRDGARVLRAGRDRDE